MAITMGSILLMLSHYPTEQQCSIVFIIFTIKIKPIQLTQLIGYGKTVLANEQNSLSIDLSNFAPSTYFLRVMVDSLIKYNEMLVIRR
jgi:hypothetical protein